MRVTYSFLINQYNTVFVVNRRNVATGRVSSGGEIQQILGNASFAVRYGVTSSILKRLGDVRTDFIATSFLAGHVFTQSTIIL